jgi:hypothetical protein
MSVGYGRSAAHTRRRSPVVLGGNTGWSVYGAPWLQPVATEDSRLPVLAERRADEVAICDRLFGKATHVPEPPDGRVQQPLSCTRRQLERTIRGERDRAGSDQQHEECRAEIGRDCEAVVEGRAAQDRRQASSGSANAVASCSADEVPSATTAWPASTPALRSIATESPVAVAPPPGRTRPAAFPLSCAAATGNHALTRRAIRSSFHRQTKLAASHATARIANGQSRWSSDRHEPKTGSRLGSSR